LKATAILLLVVGLFVLGWNEYQNATHDSISASYDYESVIAIAVLFIVIGMAGISATLKRKTTKKP
jgi:hypothetical protein